MANFAQANVARAVAVMVVELLEVVNVHHEHSGRPHQKAVDAVSQMLKQFAPVGQLCKRVRVPFHRKNALSVKSMQAVHAHALSHDNSCKGVQRKIHQVRSDKMPVLKFDRKESAHRHRKTNQQIDPPASVQKQKRNHKNDDHGRNIFLIRLIRKIGADGKTYIEEKEYVYQNYRMLFVKALKDKRQRKDKISTDFFS